MNFAQAITPGIEGSFLGYGVVGAVALLFLGALIYQYKVNQTERATARTREDLLLAKIDELQDKRVDESVKHRDEILPPLKLIAEQQQRMYEQSIITNSRGV